MLIVGTNYTTIILVLYTDYNAPRRPVQEIFVFIKLKRTTRPQSKFKFCCKDEYIVVLCTKGPPLDRVKTRDLIG